MGASRLAAVRRALTDAHVDALLVTCVPNIRYLTGFSGSAAMVVVSMTDVVFLTDFRYETQVAAEVSVATRVEVDRTSVWERLWAVLPELRGVERIGFESAHLKHHDFQRLLEKGSAWQWRPTTDVVETLRAAKDARELACIRAACEVATTALEEFVPQVRAGATELALAGVLEHALRDAGSEGYPFEATVVGGTRTAHPHARASRYELKRGDFVLVDFGAISGGYCSDITRTFVLGAPTDEQREVYDVVRSAQAVAVGGLTPGMTGRDADALARSYIERAGFGDAFGHSLGHGIGLEVHEAPRLSRVAEGVLVAGAVVTVEPGVYRAGWGGVRIEDDIHLASVGPEVLTHFPRDLIVLD